MSALGAATWAAAMMSDHGRLLDAAFARRAALLSAADTNVGRLFNGLSDGLDGLVLERLGDVLIAQCHEGRLTLPEDAVRELCTAAMQRVGARAVYRKHYPKNRTVARRELDELHRQPVPWIGAPVEPEFAVLEHRARFLVRPYDGYATGIFLDHRTARCAVRAAVHDRRVLNAFAYTCGFTVAAALGGAAATVSVDISKKALEWGKRNLAANGCALDRHRFICSDVLDYYRRAARQGHRFDWIILDPPTFSRVKDSGRAFSLGKNLAALVGGALDLLDAGGTLLLSINQHGTSGAHLQLVVREAARSRGRPCTFLPPPAPPEDFEGDPEFSADVLARFE
jgi:23S rRNA (cytosine1962-C5)-methyltransferase